MSATTPPLPATPGHTRDELLDMVGRAGTPPVDERTFRVDALSLTGHGQTSSHPGVPAGAEVVLVAASRDLLERLRAGHRVLEAAPSFVLAQDAAARPERMVVELDAFDTGPWAGTGEPHRAGVLRDLAGAAAQVRRRQGTVYVIPFSDGRHDDTRLPGLRVHAGLDAPDTEGAPASALLRALREHCGLAPEEETR